MLRTIPLVMVVGGAAFAQPKPAARVPTRPVPCAKDDITLAVSGLDPVVCWPNGCMKLDMSNTDASWIVKPAPTKPWLGNVAEVKADQVCAGSKCKPLGKKLAAAVADHLKNPDLASSSLAANSKPDLHATTDLKGVIVANALWSVANDKLVTLKPPAIYKGGPGSDKPSVSSIDVAGDLLVINWTDCAGPCTKFAIADSSGTYKGPTGEGGGDVFQLDAKRFVVTSEYSTLSIFGFDGKLKGAVSLQGEPDSSAAMRMDDDTIVVMYGKTDGKVVAKVSVIDDKKIPFRVSESQFLPKCGP